MSNPALLPVSALPAALLESAKRATSTQNVPITHRSELTYNIFTQEGVKEAKSHVSTTMMLEEWNKVEDDKGQDRNSFDGSKQAMNYLNVKLQQLRKSRTVDEMRKASMYVAAALLRVATDVNCQNPFVCLRQARIFASHCIPGADNDIFRKPLPRDDCTPLQALSVIGHADCMSALSYFDESVFLAKYVARLCASRRQNREVWNPQWRIVAVNLCIVAHKISTPNAFSWGKEVQSELDAASKDYSSLLRSDIIGNV